MGDSVEGSRSPRRVRPALLVLLWIWAICVFVVVDLFLNVTELDEVRPRSKLYEGMREAAHEMVGERYRRRPEHRAPLTPRSNGNDMSRLAVALSSLAQDPSTAGADEIARLAEVLGPELPAESRRIIARLLFELHPLELREQMGRALAPCVGDEELALHLLSRIDDELDIEHTLPALCTALAGIQAECVVPELVSRIETASGARRRELIRAVGGIGGSAAEEGLMALLGRELDQETRFAVVCAWPPAGLDRLVESTARMPPHANASAVQILGRTGDERFAPVVLAAHANSKDNQVIRNSLRALGQLGTAAAVERLLLVMNAPDGVYADAAQEAMQHVRNIESLELLASRWEQLGTKGRTAILLAIAEIPEQTKALRRLAMGSLQENEIPVRTAAAWALGRVGADDAVEPLGRYLLQAETDSDRLAGAQALSRIQSKTAAEAGLNALSRNPGKGDLSEYETAFRRLALNG